MLFIFATSCVPPTLKVKGTKEEETFSEGEIEEGVRQTQKKGDIEIKGEETYRET